LAHFPATLTEIRQELSRQEVPHHTAERPISAKEVNRLGGPPAERLVRLGLVRQLQPEPFPDQDAAEDGLIQILVAERHFVRECDEAVMTFAEGLGKRCQVTYHYSLEDPLMKAFGGEWVKGVLQRLGMDESAPVESAMVARRVRRAQGKFAASAGRGCDADSAEEWLQSNGFGDCQ
jgi:preprotein translocase subunit SecA